MAKRGKKTQYGRRMTAKQIAAAKRHMKRNGIKPPKAGQCRAIGGRKRGDTHYANTMICRWGGHWVIT